MLAARTVKAVPRIVSLALTGCFAGGLVSLAGCHWLLWSHDEEEFEFCDESYADCMEEAVTDSDRQWCEDDVRLCYEACEGTWEADAEDDVADDADADDDAAGPALRRRLHQRRIAHRHGAEDDTGDAGIEPAFDGRLVADAAAKLDRQRYCLTDRLHRFRIGRLAGEGAVEIDQMQVAEAGLLPLRCLRRRIAVEDGDAIHVALLQAHAFAVFKVNGGIEIEAAHSTRTLV